MALSFTLISYVSLPLVPYSFFFIFILYLAVTLLVQWCPFVQNGKCYFAAVVVIALEAIKCICQISITQSTAKRKIFPFTDVHFPQYPSLPMQSLTPLISSMGWNSLEMWRFGLMLFLRLTGKRWTIAVCGITHKLGYLLVTYKIKVHIFLQMYRGIWSIILESWSKSLQKQWPNSKK